MTQQYETKEETKTVTLYKEYTAKELDNKIEIVWVKYKPFKLFTSLEDSLGYLKRNNERFLKEAREDLIKAESALLDAKARIQKWEGIVSTEPTVVDKTK